MILTPHIGWQRVEARQRVVDGCGDNIAKFTRGEARKITVFPTLLWKKILPEKKSGRTGKKDKGGNLDEQILNSSKRRFFLEKEKAKKEVLVGLASTSGSDVHVCFFESVERREDSGGFRRKHRISMLTQQSKEPKSCC